MTTAPKRVNAGERPTTLDRVLNADDWNVEREQLNRILQSLDNRLTAIDGGGAGGGGTGEQGPRGPAGQDGEDGAFAACPYIIEDGETFTVPENKQILWTVPIDIEDGGALDVEGILVEVD